MREEPLGRQLVCTSDLDDLVARVTAIMSPHTVAPARPGGFTAQVFGVHIPGLSLLEMDYGMPLRLTAEPFPDYVAVALPLTGSMTATHHGRRFDARAGRSALVGSPWSELVMDWDEALRMLVLRIDLAALRSLAARLVTDRSEEPDLLFDPAMDVPEITTAALGQARLMQHLLADAGPKAVNPLVTAQLREQVMCTLLLGQPNNWSPALRHRPEHARHSTVADAANLMRTHPEDALTIEGVARTVGLSVRALHAGFCRELDRSPKQYLQQVRLERAHADLTAAEPGSGIRVIDIAHRWGFSHPGRFASSYRHHYGEAPATTLARQTR
ncbi:AraC family transcriptional regulator [Pseudonocardia sp. KRD291]|uniref:AraC family transcriptional regulator n=1 Tax=Pseudonocardia sp. KRD291 TaxID=2792007 RepID=UPI001C4A04F8|nr:AraC family transcriptional regulator [Pseudonocardia sp. KRD291]MBW0100875.1 AraC family transcriptional regulator [Pseudonocardia sp. KRD291]